MYPEAGVWKSEECSSEAKIDPGPGQRENSSIGIVEKGASVSLLLGKLSLGKVSLIPN